MDDPGSKGRVEGEVCKGNIRLFGCEGDSDPSILWLMILFTQCKHLRDRDQRATVASQGCCVVPCPCQIFDPGRRCRCGYGAMVVASLMLKAVGGDNRAAVSTIRLFAAVEGRYGSRHP